MKLSHFDSRPLAEEGVECVIVDPVTMEKTKAGMVMLGADSATYKNKLKECQEKRRLQGHPVTPEEVDEDSIEILAVCVKSWHDFEDDDGKELPLTLENARAAFKIPYIYSQVGSFTTTRANFFEKASAR